MVPGHRREPREGVAVQRQHDGGFVADHAGGVDVVIGHRHAIAGFNHHFADLHDTRAAGFGCVVGAAEELMDLAPGDGRIDAPDAVVMRRGLLAGQTDGQVQRMAIVVLDQQRMVAALGHRHLEVGKREQVGFFGECRQLQLDPMQRAGGDPLMGSDGMDIGHQFGAGSLAFFAQNHGGPLEDGDPRIADEPGLRDA